MTTATNNQDMRITSLYLPATLLDAVHERAAVEDRTTSSLIRQALRAYLGNALQVG